MKLILSPKANINKIELEGVETFCDEGPTLCVIFKDGRVRNYPHIHLWYWQTEIDMKRSKPPYKDKPNTERALES